MADAERVAAGADKSLGICEEYEFDSLGYGVLDLDRVESIVRSAKPAHVPHRVEVVAAGPAKKARAKSPDPATPEGSPEAGS